MLEAGFFAVCAAPALGINAHNGGGKLFGLGGGERGPEIARKSLVGGGAPGAGKNRQKGGQHLFYLGGGKRRPEDRAKGLWGGGPRRGGGKTRSPRRVAPL